MGFGCCFARHCNPLQFAMQFYEDIEIGRERAFGQYQVTREEVMEFSSKYDPQSFHLDEEAAAQTHFGRLSASGWHTCSMTMAMMDIVNRKKILKVRGKKNK